MAGMFNEAKHKRGTGAQGGQFVAKGTSGAGDTLGYDSKRGTGAGYGTGSKGDNNVKSLQTYLNNLGFTDSQGKPLKVDGKLGPRTTSAVKRLQRKLGLKADGLVTPALLRQLRQASLKKGKGPAKKTAPVPRRKAPAKKAAPAPGRKATPAPFKARMGSPSRRAADTQKGK
jgi:peptidoglycan hydrolase-like protein with peptidoglycan-binding domain